MGTGKYYYFSAHKDRFDRDCQVIFLPKGNDLALTAKIWARTNGYNEVFVYNMEHRLISTIVHNETKDENRKRSC